MRPPSTAPARPAHDPSAYDLRAEHLTLPVGREHAAFLLRWTRRAEDELHDDLHAATPQGSLFAPSGRRLLAFMLLLQLERVCAPTFDALLAERLRAKNPVLALDLRLATGAEKTAASQGLLEELETGGAEVLFSQAPLLEGELDRATDRFVSMARALTRRLAADREAIGRDLLGGRPAGPVTGVAGDGADLHFGGQMTCVVRTEDARFVYKPHDCRIDAAFGALAGRWFADDLVVPRVLVRDGYGWCSFVEHAPVQDPEAVDRFFFRLGRAAALFQALGSTDLHAQNWVAQGERPALVDLETVLAPVPRVFSDPAVWPEGTTGEQGFLRDCNRSLIPSGLLPRQTFGTGSEAHGGGADGDAASAGRNLSVLLDTSPGSRCLPVLDGRPHTVLGHEDAFFEGFSSGYDTCLEHREALLTCMDAFAEVPVRLLLRQTSYYAVLQERLRRPTYLQAVEKRAEALGRMEGYFAKHGAPHLTPIARWEASCLLGGDIPYFCTRADGHDLCGHGCAKQDVVVPGFFEASAIENARERIGRLSATEKRFEVGLLQQALAQALLPAEQEKKPPAQEAPTRSEEERPASSSAAAGDPQAPTCRPKAASASRDLLTPQEALEEAEKIFWAIESALLTGPSGESSWVMRVGEADNLREAPATLAQGTAGLGVFFCACARAFGCDSAAGVRARELVELCLDKMELTAGALGRARTIPEEAVPLGITAGIGGALLALAHMERSLPTGRAQKLADAFVGLLDKVPLQDAHQSDVFSGTAGLVVGLADLASSSDPVGPAGPGADVSVPIAHHLRRAADQLLAQRSPALEGGLWDTLGLGRGLSGAGHGMAGIAAALLGAARILGDERYLAAARDALGFEHEAYCDRLGTWPDLRASARPARAMHGLCSGAPGVGLALLRCRSELRRMGSAIDPTLGHFEKVPAQGGQRRGVLKAHKPLPNAVQDFIQNALDEDVKRAINACLVRPPLFRDHLCCGNSAVVDLLLETGRSDCLEAAAVLMGTAAHRGWRLLPPHVRRSFCPDLWYGVAGVGYELLRLADPEGVWPVLFGAD